MIDVLLICDEIEDIKLILKDIIGIREDFRVINVTTSIEEVINSLQNEKMDLIISNSKKIIINNGEMVKRMESMRLKTMPKIIVITDNAELIETLKDDSIVTEVYDKNDGKEVIMERIKNLKIESQRRDSIKTTRNRVVSELLYIGFNPKHLGTQYLLESILYIYNSPDRTVTNNLENLVYKPIGEKYHKTKDSVKSCILKATNCMFDEGDASRIREYFSIADKSRPTPKQIISKILYNLYDVVI